MGRTRRQTLPAWLVKMALAAMHGPSVVENGFYEGMTHADRGRWDTDGHRVAKNGNPTPVEGVDAYDGHALHFGADDNDELVVSQSQAFEFSATDPFTVGSFISDFPTPSGGHNQNVIDKKAGGAAPGFFLYAVDDGADQDPTFRIGDGNGNVAQGRGQAGLGDGQRHLFGGTADRDVEAIRVLLDDTVKATADSSSVGSLSDTSQDLRIPPTTSRAFRYGASFVHPQWMAREQWAFLDALLRGNVAPGTLRRLDELVYGHRETGLKRRKPPYVQQSIWDNLHFFVDAGRLPFYVDGGGLTQVPNEADGPLTVQRTETDKLLANGQAKRGYFLDAIQGNGSQEATLETGPSDVDQFFAMAAGPAPGTSSNERTFYGRRDSGGAFVRFAISSSDNIVLRLQDDSGTAKAVAQPIDGSKSFSVACRYDKSADEMDVWLRQGGTTATNNTTQSFGTISGDQGDAIFSNVGGANYDGNLQVTGASYTAPTKTDSAQQVTDLAKATGYGT